MIDANGSYTQFASPYGTDTGQVVQITDPYGAATTLGFTGSEVSSVDQANPTSQGGTGDAITRLTYPSSTQTLVADPTTSQSQAVSAVAHTTYTIDSSSNLVTKSVDPDNDTRSATYTTLGQVATATSAAGGTSTNTYGSNSGESLTSAASPGGATDSAKYTNTGSTAYLPSSSTDDANNALTNTYDTNGNQTGSSQGASGPAAKVDYNSDGTAKDSMSPGATAMTTYTYANGDGDLTSITPPSNSSLAARAYTWDGFGRLATATDGAGDTITYSYDNLDRITKVAYSDGTPSVSYTYNKNGHVTQRVDASGTTTYTYDDLGHLLTVKNTANNNLITYSYNLDGTLNTVTDGLGTTTYGYDAARELTKMTYPQGSGTLETDFANNSDGRRTDVWLQAYNNHATWAAHEHFTYDTSGRITGVLGQNGGSGGPTTVENETLCYTAHSNPGSSCPAATGSGATSTDRSNIQWTSETVSGESNTYTYDDHDRLIQDVVTGGSNPRTYSYMYDNAGNRTSSSVTGTSPSSQTLAYNDGNQIKTSGYTYDGAGDLTVSPKRTATFNAAGQQTSATVSGVKSTYTYAGTNDDEVVSEAIPNDHTYNLTYGRPDKNGQPEVDTVNVPGVGTGYVLSDPSGQPVMLSTSAGVTCLYLYDGIHNPVGLSSSNATTAQAFAYDPYGGSTTTNNTGYSSAYQNPYTFGEGLLDRATGEVKFGQRFYSPITGNWTQQDALNAPLDAGNANRYEYAADNPINSADPTGQDFLSLGINLNLGPVHVGIGVDVGDGGFHPYAQAGVGVSAGADDSPISPTASVNSGSAESGGSVGATGCVSGVCDGTDGPSVDLTGSTGASADATYTF